MLDAWTAWLTPHIDAGGEVFAFFNNDIDAHAPEEARRLRTRLEEVRSSSAMEDD